ncbi:hypothetical protein [Timonella senegalensis]|uniref:hypothetical protein n=1 Tax=Timonella senegalensis TaxID=1465825 RepID=UPI0028B18249|nr:hypothetical protein [Timonella senegalensis]
MNAQLFNRETAIREGGNTQLIFAAVLFVGAAVFSLLWVVNVIEHPSGGDGREISYPIIAGGAALIGLLFLIRALWNKARRADVDYHIAIEFAALAERQEAQIEELVDRVRRINASKDHFRPENTHLEPDLEVKLDKDAN